MLTHSTTDKVHYTLKLNGQPIEPVTRFQGLWQTVSLTNPITAKSMAELKQKVWDALPDAVRNPPPKSRRYSMKDWVELCAISHTGIRIYTEEAKKIWPELKGTEMAGYLIRKHMEALTRWQNWPSSREIGHRWMAANPEVGNYDHDEERRRIDAIYGPQPEWTY